MSANFNAFKDFYNEILGFLRNFLIIRMTSKKYVFMEYKLLCD